MMSRRSPWSIVIATFVLSALLLVAGSAPTPALDLGLGIGDLVKIFGIGWAVDHFAKDINKAINAALAQRDAEISGYTKVVPIIRIGRGGKAIGAAQVMGPQQQVEQVKAVAEVELGIAGTLRARGLVPISTKSSLKTVGGVGVSANIKFPI